MFDEHASLGSHRSADKPEVIGPGRHTDTYLNVAADPYLMIQE